MIPQKKVIGFDVGRSSWQMNCTIMASPPVSECLIQRLADTQGPMQWLCHFVKKWCVKQFFQLWIDKVLQHVQAIPHINFRTISNVFWCGMWILWPPYIHILFVNHLWNIEIWNIALSENMILAKKSLPWLTVKLYIIKLNCLRLLK